MYFDLLAKIKNAQRAKMEVMHAPFSNFDLAVLKVLVEKKYLQDVQKRNVGKKSVLDVRLRYTHKEPAMTDFKIISKPSRRLYKGYAEFRPVKQGHGHAVISTPQGVMTGSQARKAKVGGEYLFEIW